MRWALNSVRRSERGPSTSTVVRSPSSVCMRSRTRCSERVIRVGRHLFGGFDLHREVVHIVNDDAGPSLLHSASYGMYCLS